MDKECRCALTVGECAYGGEASCPFYPNRAMKELLAQMDSLDADDRVDDMILGD